MLSLQLYRTKEKGQLVSVEIHTRKHILLWQSTKNLLVPLIESTYTPKWRRWFDSKIGTGLILLLSLGMMLWVDLFLRNLVLIVSTFSN
jgi:hypothetical protein